MTSRTEAQERVSRGAAHLDQHVPNWWTRIDIDILDLADECGCIVGQLCGSYNDSEPDWLDTELVDDESDLGLHVLRFDDPREVDESDPSWRLLQDAWIEAIAVRLFSSESA